ncbi:MAG: hypothetical protein CVV23_14100 [Ignavibacteriae bacterium HGW-Ignavibacteriae-2]|nr:CvpA family protein [Bacteroidota bacterium]PKL87692.1 MAG: hypothetical protein CVV23_14100 [Ignavibacteriae bacterium HGW-Ignavibacteriae-2]
MNYIDYIILAVIIIGFILGYKDGLVRKIIGILGFILGIILAFQFSKSISSYVSPLLNDELYLAEIVSGFLIFSLTIFIFAILKRVIHPFDKVNRFVNQLLGGFAGSIQIIFLISAFLLLLNLFDAPNQQTKNESILYNKTYSVIPKTIDLILGNRTNAQNYIIDFIESEEDSL